MSNMQVNIINEFFNLFKIILKNSNYLDIEIKNTISLIITSKVLNTQLYTEQICIRLVY